MRYVGEPTGPQRRTKNRAPRHPTDSGHDDMPPPPMYDTVQSAGKKPKKPKKAPAGAAAAAAREDDQRNVCHSVLCVEVVSCVQCCIETLPVCVVLFVQFML